MDASNCSKCKYGGDRGCAVNAEYWSAIERIRDLSADLQRQIMPHLAQCPDFEEEELLTLNLALYAFQWKALISGRMSRQAKDAGDALERQICMALGCELPQKDECPF